jgi:hypothetical protein
MVKKSVKRANQLLAFGCRQNHSWSFGVDGWPKPGLPVS